MQGETEADRPHPGRIYDYVMGGTHNFEVDRVAADQFVKMMPSIPVIGRLNRAFLKVAAQRWTDEGISHILDLGSGLPTQGHLNEYMPKAQILFTDSDPYIAKSGQEILQGRSGQQYLQLDVLRTEKLESAVNAAFKDDRRLGIGLFGVTYFFSDDQVRNLLQKLHALCSPQSVLAMSYLSASNEEAAEALVQEYARLVNTRLHLRTPDEMTALLAPWYVLENQPLQQFTRTGDPLLYERAQEAGLRFHGVFASIPDAPGARRSDVGTEPH